MKVGRIKMTPTNEYVEGRNGGYYVAGTRIGLDVVVYDFRLGRSAEAIFEAYPSIGSLAKVYGAITFILEHPDAVEAYLKDQDRVMRAAQEKAQAIVDEAANKHEEMLDQNEIVQRARTTAEVVLREAEERARKIREGADQYAAQVLAEMEGRLAGALGAVRKGRETLNRQPAQPAAAAPAAAPLAEAAAKSKRAAFDLQNATEEDTTQLESVKA